MQLSRATIVKHISLKLIDSSPVSDQKKKINMFITQKTYPNPMLIGQSHILPIALPYFT